MLWRLQTFTLLRCSVNQENASGERTSFKTKTMRLFFLTLTAFFAVNLPGQHLQIGDQVPSASLFLLGEETEALSTTDLRGKAILLDFWATWCSPCIGAMPHLDELQNEFVDDLQVIAVSEEKQDRLLRFIQKTDHDFLFARDTGALRALFHYQVIPHSVLISPTGVVVAITDPDNITSEVIRKVVRQEQVDLPIKQDRQDFDPTYDYFQADTLTRTSFQLQPHKPNLPSYSKSYWVGPFKQRRYTAYNMTLDGLYRHAYQASSHRIVFEFDEALVDWEKEENRYCMDIIAADPASLLPSLKEHLSSTLSIQARLEKRTKDVVVITTLEGKVVAPEGISTEQYTGRGDGFSSTGATMSTFCDYLEGFGIFGFPVVDETGSETAYKIDFSFDPENADTFKEAMTKYGLKYAKAQREIEVLVLYLEE